MKISKPFCASTRHAQCDHRVPFLKSLKCRRSSSDKLFFWTDGRTDRGNNIPELSVETEGIVTAYNIISQHLESCMEFK